MTLYDKSPGRTQKRFSAMPTVIAIIALCEDLVRTVFDEEQEANYGL